MGLEPPPVKTRGIKRNTALFCGWGRLIFGQTFSDHNRIIDIFSSEPAGKRDLAIYVKNHHVFWPKPPTCCLLTPPHTYRLWLHHYRMPRKRSSHFRIRLLKGKEDAEQVNTIYRKCGLIESPVSTIVENQKTHTFSYFVAEDSTDRRIIGTITRKSTTRRPSTIRKTGPAFGAWRWTRTDGPEGSAAPSSVAWRNITWPKGGNTWTCSFSTTTTGLSGCTAPSASAGCPCSWSSEKTKSTGSIHREDPNREHLRANSHR